MTTATIEKKGAGVSLATWIVLAVLAVAGLAAWGYQLSTGMGATGLGQQVVWGLYIGGFFAAAGAGAGLLILAGISVFNPVLDDTERGTVLLAALGSFVAAGLLIMMDLGSPLRAWRIAVAGEWSSLMTWDFWVLIVTMAVTLVFAITSRAGKANRVLAVLGIALALALVLVESWLVSVNAARPFWGGGLTVVSFLLSAAVAGLAIARLVACESGAKLSRWLSTALIASLALVLFEMLTTLVGSAPAEREILGVVIGDPIFWTHIVLGIVIPLGLLWFGGSAGAGVLAAGLALLGILAEKSWFLAAGLTFPVLELAPGSYTPSLIEAVTVLGAIGVGGLVTLLLKRLIKAGEA